MPTNKNKKTKQTHYTKERAAGRSTENTEELMRDQNSDRKLVMLLFKDSRVGGWRDLELIKVLQIDYIVCVYVKRSTKYLVSVKLIKRKATGYDCLSNVSFSRI